MRSALISRLAASAAACASLVLGLTGCSFQYSIGSPKVTAGTEVAAQVSSELAKQEGRPPEKVTCPDLPAEVGRRITCQLTDQGKTYDVVVTATGVEGDRVTFNLQVGTVPIGAPPPTAAALPEPEPVARPSAAARPSASPAPRADGLTVRGTDVATQVRTKWREQNGRVPSSVTCPSLRGAPGAKVTCRLTDRGQDYDIAVVATRVTGTKVDFTMTSRPR